MIHYHGTPCGATRLDVARFLNGRHAFISFFRPEDIGTAAEVCQSFAIDNGAYSAWRNGQPITDWSEYYTFVEMWQRHPGCDWAIIPDVIDGTESENDRLLEEWPHPNGVPVWHLHESMERLEKLADRNDRVAIGSSGQWANVGSREWWIRMSSVMQRVCDRHGRPKAKLHGLRMLDPAVFHKLPLASADSTNAVRNSSNANRFGQYIAPNPSTRMSIIAERIEAHQSAATWDPPTDRQLLLYDKLTLTGDQPCDH